MSQLTAILESDISADLLSALLHSLWEGLVIGIVLFLFLRSKPAKSANIRYVTSLIALTATVLCVFFTWSILNYKPASRNDTVSISQTEGVMTAPVTQVQDNLTATIPAKSKNIPTAGAGLNWKPYAICLWLTGAIIMLFRAICLVVGGNRLQLQCTALNDEFILEQVELLRNNLGITRRIRITVSEHITIPGVVGFISPLLILPVSMVSGVPADALQAILAHELAHIRRYDYLVNFCQMVVEAILFFNPAVWWISRQIRIEREACCDNAGIAAIGRRIRYAEVLIGWAQKMKERDIKYAASAIGFGQPDNSGGITERIRRIVSTEHRPQLKVSWRIAGITLILSFAALVGLWQGTNLTVTFAGNLLTPQERIDKITEISKEFGSEKYGSGEKIRISGVVRTWDGKALPRSAGLTLTVEQPRNTEHISIGISKQNPFSENGTFNHTVGCGTIYVSAYAEGYVPSFAGPFDAKPGQDIESIEVVLEKGFPTKIKVVDEAGNPVKEAHLNGSYPMKGLYSPAFNVITDSNGIVAIEHATDNKEAAVTIKAEGFELYEAKGLILKPDETATLKLTQSKITSGIVLSKATGKPIEGAKVWILISASTMENGSFSNGKNSEPDTNSDENGRFSLTKLRNNYRYFVLVEAEGYFRRYLIDLMAGEKDLKIELAPPKIIRGRITGDLEKLSKDMDGTPILTYTQKYEYAHNSSLSSHGKSPVTIKDSIGYFAIDECWGQSVIISAGDKQISVNMDEDLPEEILIDLSPQNTREVVLRFNVPQGAPAIDGVVRIDYSKPGDRSMKYQRLEIQDNQARYEIPVPGKLQYQLDDRGKRSVGYWFNKINPIDIPSGDGLYVIDVPVYPAGAIYGTIRRPDGTIMKDAKASLTVVKKPEILGMYSYGTLVDMLNNGGVDQGTFNATPLPLGGEYAIVANEGYAYTISDIIKLDEKNQIVKVELTVPEGVNVQGRLLDSNDNPVRIPVTMYITLKRGESSSNHNGPEVPPDENGRFVFQNVNPGPNGTCTVRVKGLKGFRPANYEIKDLTKPVIIRLEKGLSATGRIIDDKTGWPIPGVEVRAYFSEEIDGKVQFESVEAEAPTNDKGEFVFTNMSEHSYNLSFSGVNSDNPRLPSMLIGGQEIPIIIRSTISEWSDLKPRKPD
jgi:beta-lactamase regulating signal transducer with metallopeptidase domain/uncharacterized GH25 family protein